MMLLGHKGWRRLPSLLLVTRGARALSAGLYTTTPIYYVNAAPHVGHAYTSVACDALKRFAELDGRPALLCTGTDEHGEKVEESARKEGSAPLEFATRVSETFRELADAYDVSYDHFVRTTSERHKAAVAKLWNVLRERDQLYLGSYEGWYSVRDECYYAESEIGADGKAPTGADVEWRTKEPSYFFKLSHYQDRLREAIASDELLVRPKSRKNEVLSFLENEVLRDLSVSRTSFTWGVPVPNDADHVIYVWLDALANYISAIGYDDDDEAMMKKWWHEAQTVHVVGKDILRFHAVYWPAICLAADLPMPSAIVAHGWWTKDGQKISKSLGNVVDPFDLAQTYGTDATRYFMLSEVPFGSDGDFSKTAMLAAVNGFLANALGNFAQRVCVMLTKAPCDGTAPSAANGLEADLLKFAPDQPDLLRKARALPQNMRQHMYDDPTSKAFLRFDLALAEIEDVVRDANKFFDTAAPWTLKKTDPDAMRRVLAVSLELLRCVAIAYQPFMPSASTKLLDQIGVSESQRLFADIQGRPGLPAGTPIAKPQPVFPRITLEEDVSSGGARRDEGGGPTTTKTTKKKKKNLVPKEEIVA
mmetsp:Transcript_13823/g.41797  ORF Transcript_13823/g.41797 Transcript_13823/m.41797 type:complete len:590 (+) Transcript_13823:3-1772(+)